MMILATCILWVLKLSYLILFPFLSSGGEPSDDVECDRSNMEKCDPKSIEKNLNLYRNFLPSPNAWRYVPF